jgi:hypothetical protein
MRPAQQEQAAGDDEDDEGQMEDQHGTGQKPGDHCSTLRALTRAASRCTRSIRRFLDNWSIMAVSGAWRSVYPKLVDWVEGNMIETLTIYRLPRAHHKHRKSTNMLEWLNEEIKRRTPVVRISNPVCALSPPFWQNATRNG